MKKSFSTPFILLAVSVVALVRNNDVYESGSEGKPAVIRCPYTASYKHYPKYFCKGNSADCETLIVTDRQEGWTIKGRLSLNDNTEQNMFVVTISNLNKADEGQYGCGIKTTRTTGEDWFTVVHLSVMKVPSTQESSTDSTGSSTQPPASHTLSGRPPEGPTQNTKLQLLSVIFMYAGAALLVLSVIFCVFKWRVVKGSAGQYLPSSTENMEDVRVYEEIQHSNPSGENASESPDITSSPNLYPKLNTVYSTITNQKQEPQLSNTFPTNPESCSMGLPRDLTENLREPKY